MHLKFLYRQYVPLWMRRKLFMLRHFFAYIYCFFIIKFFNRRNIFENKGTVALMRLDGIGDFIIWLDAAKEFRAMFPSNRIILVCGKECADIAASTGYFDIVFPIDKSDMISARPLSKFRLRKKLSALTADKLIQCAPNYVMYVEFIAASIYAKEKITIDYDSTGQCRPDKKEADTLASAVFDNIIRTQSHVIHEIQRNAEFMRALGHKYKTKFPIIKIHKPNSLAPKGKYYILVPGANVETRRWDINKFAEVASYICNKTGFSCCICGSKDERILGDELIKISQTADRLINMCGTTELMELAALIKDAEFVITNDTSALHFAAAVNTPSICIFGPWELGRILPYDADITEGCSAPIMCYKGMPCKNCYKNITVECQKNITKNNRFLCIEKVEANYVIKEVEHLLNTLERNR